MSNKSKNNKQKVNNENIDITKKQNNNNYCEAVNSSNGIKENNISNDTETGDEIINYTARAEQTNKERLKEIITILNKNKAVESLITSKHPERIKNAFEELGPTFIKMGQMLSTRTDLISEDLAEEFKKLQDNVKTDDFLVIKSIIESAYGTSINDIFDNFNEVPIASASMAQVHRANLKDGTLVAVKVQHAGIKSMMLNDIALFEKAIPFFKITSASKIMDPVNMLKELKKSCENELNFIIEAKNIHLFYKNNSQFDYMDCIKAYPEYSKEDILVMDYVSGTKVTDIEKLKGDNFDVKAIAQNLINNYMKQAFEDGFFHADPHPGNILIRNGKITFLDFGMMGIMSDIVLNKLNDVLYAVYIKNTKELTKSILRLCVRKGKVDKEKLNSDVEDFYFMYIDEVSLKDMNFSIIISKLTSLCLENNLAIPEEVTMFMRGVINIVGVVETLDSSLTLMSALEPYMQKYIASKFNPVNEIKDYAKSIYDMGKITPQIPVKIAETLDKVNDGDLKFNVEHNHNNLEKIFKQLDYITNKLVIGVLLFALILGSSILATSGNQFEGHSLMSIIGIIGYVVAAVLTVTLIISIIKNKR